MHEPGKIKENIDFPARIATVWPLGGGRCPAPEAGAKRAMASCMAAER